MLQINFYDWKDHYLSISGGFKKIHFYRYEFRSLQSCSETILIQCASNHPFSQFLYPKSKNSEYVYVCLTSVPQKNVPSAVVIYYCAWYVFLRDRRCVNSRQSTNRQHNKSGHITPITLFFISFSTENFFIHSFH